ncbi:MAG: PD-(D/E)XK nuclease family protein [Clostridia bacterium]|nr:PD-(D/E)XK nuclease family protein [Clostridia bacterium]
MACYGLESNINKIKEIFEKYEINYYIDNQISINKSVFYKFLLSIFKHNIESYNIVHLLDIINSPFFEADIDLKHELIDKLLEVKFKGKFKTVLDFGQELIDIQKKLIEFLSYFDFEKDDTLNTIKNKLLQADKYLDFAKVLNDIIMTTANVKNQILLKKSRDTIYNLIDDVIKFYPEANLEIFYDIFSHISSILKINNIPLTLDAVKVVDADNNMEIFQDLYIINCTNENAPNLKYDCGIILDHEIEKLNFSNKLSPTIAHINRLAKLRLFNSVMLFENNLMVCYSNTASDIVKEFANKLQVKVEGKLHKLIAMQNFEFLDYTALSEWDNIEFLCKYDNKNKKLFENLITNKEINNISLKNLKIYDNLKTISPSALENYFKCPLLFFITNILKVKPRLDNEVLSLDVGNILHEIMFKYYKANKQVGDLYEFCVKQIFAFIEKDARLKINMDSPVLKNLIDEAVRVINGLNYIDENSLFKVRTDLLEIGFFNHNALKLENIDVVGKVDRVDEHDGMLRIVDYKSGRADASLKELYFGNKLQLFLYANAIEQKEKKKIVGEFYLPLHNAFTREVANTYSLKGFFTNNEYVVRSLDKRLVPQSKSDIVNVRLNKDGDVIKTVGHKELDTAQMDDLKEYSKDVAVKAVNEIKSGYIMPTPSDVSKPCEYCPYVHICMKSSNAIKYRASDDVNLDSFKRGQK